MPQTDAPVTVRRLTTAERASEIGAALRRRRIRSGLTQEELARLADLSVGAVKGLESAKGSSLNSLLRVSRALGVDGWIDALVVQEPSVSPMKLLREQQASQRRRRPARRRAAGAVRAD